MPSSAPDFNGINLGRHEIVIGIDGFLNENAEDEERIFAGKIRLCSAKVYWPELNRSNINKVINIKTKQEIEVMREGGKILAEILKKLVQAVKPGIETNDLESIARELIERRDVKPSFLGYGDFPAVLCISINEEVVHGVPSSRKLLDGDLLKLDIGIQHKGFHTDTATTVIVGESSDPEKNRLLSITKEALNVGISKAIAGNTMGDIGYAIQKFAESNGFNVTRELIGHGIGKDLHEAPEVPNFGEPGTGPKIVEGMVIAIEPMLVTGDWKVKEKGFVFSTKDKGLAAHFEHTVAIVDGKPVIL